MTVVTSTTQYISKDTCSNPLSNFCSSTLILTMINQRNTDCIILYLEIKLHSCNKNEFCLNLIVYFLPWNGYSFIGGVFNRFNLKQSLHFNHFDLRQITQSGAGYKNQTVLVWQRIIYRESGPRINNLVQHCSLPGVRTIIKIKTWK